MAHAAVPAIQVRCALRPAVHDHQTESRQVDIGQAEVAIVGTGELAIGVQPFEVELDRPLRQDLGAAGGDEGGHDRVEAVAARVAAASTRRQVNMAIRRMR